MYIANISKALKFTLKPSHIERIDEESVTVLVAITSKGTDSFELSGTEHEISSSVDRLMRVVVPATDSAVIAAISTAYLVPEDIVVNMLGITRFSGITGVVATDIEVVL